jgi:uncharacterized protein YaiI (UPF0178 family)
MKQNTTMIRVRLTTRDQLDAIRKQGERTWTRAEAVERILKAFVSQASKPSRRKAS